MNKKVIWDHCIAHVEAKIASSQNHLLGLKEASANDTKSSAGDKFETSREMMQQEMNKAEAHLAELQKQLQLLNGVSSSRRSEEVELGSFVISDKGSFFISLALGKIKMSEGYFYGISTESPMGAALIGLKKGEHTVVNGREIHVLEIY